MSFYSTDNPDRRDRIMSASLKLFVHKGFFNTSVHEIREKADVSIGLLYRYFKNKKDIAAALYTELIQITNEVVGTLIDEHETAHDRCRAIMFHYLHLTETFPELVEYIFFIRHREILQNKTQICASSGSKKTLTVIHEGIESGEIRKMSPDVAMVALFGGMFRIIQKRLDGVLQNPVTVYQDELWEASWLAVSASR